MFLNIFFKIINKTGNYFFDYLSIYKLKLLFMKTKLLLSIFLFLGSYIVGAQINITPTINNVTCYNACDGSISLSISGGTPGYTYLWSNGYMTPLLSGVCAGMYTVTVTDATALQGIQTFTITQPAPLNISITSTNVLCNGLCDGTATTSISGGTPPYTYMWNNGNPTPEIIGICAGTYTLTITDANGCSAAHSVTITQPVALSSTITSTTNNICNGDCNGSATVSAFGGTPPFTYTWCNANTTNTCTNMCAGTCGVTTTDVNGCTVVTNVTITEPSAIVVTTNVTNASCTNNDGQIDVIPTGGVPPYNSVWSNGSNTNTITNLATGNYSVTTVDANGCSTSTFATLGFSSFPAILSGTANYSSGSLNAGDAVVNLFKENGSGSGNFDTISVQTLSSTGFYFNNLMPGLYHLSINLTNPSSYPNLLNTYYNNKFVWTDADTIILACSDTINLPVQMYEIVSSPGGNCNLSGTILYGNYTGFKNINAVGEPVPGAEILIEQEPNDVPIESAITDINGHYLIGNISTGNNYRLIVDIPGYQQLNDNYSLC